MINSLRSGLEEFSRAYDQERWLDIMSEDVCFQYTHTKRPAVGSSSAHSTAMSSISSRGSGGSTVYTSYDRYELDRITAPTFLQNMVRRRDHVLNGGEYSYIAHTRQSIRPQQARNFLASVLGDG